MTDLRTLISSFGNTASTTAVALSKAQSVQWEVPPRLGPDGEDTTERSQGTRSDPTAAIATNAQRLKLRAAVVGAEQAFTRAERQLAEAGAELERALAPYFQTEAPLPEEPTAERDTP